MYPVYDLSRPDPLSVLFNAGGMSALGVSQHSLS